MLIKPFAYFWSEDSVTNIIVTHRFSYTGIHKMQLTAIC